MDEKTYVIGESTYRQSEMTWGQMKELQRELGVSGLMNFSILGMSEWIALLGKNDGFADKFFEIILEPIDDAKTRLEISRAKLSVVRRIVEDFLSLNGGWIPSFQQLLSFFVSVGADRETQKNMEEMEKA